MTQAFQRRQPPPTLPRPSTRSADLVAGPPPEDLVVQSMEDASPAKWHLAHTSRFFERFVLRACGHGNVSPDWRFAYLLSFYYVQAGPRCARARRGLIAGPTVAEVMAYRAWVDQAVDALVAGGTLPGGALVLIELGCHHEMQHQELLRPLRLAHRPVTNRDGIAFIDAVGYRDARHWLSDGWSAVRREDWKAPGYSWHDDERWWSMSLCGAQPVDPDFPVAPVSCLEADAFPLGRQAPVASGRVGGGQRPRAY